jgi:hypothetical protein
MAGRALQWIRGQGLEELADKLTNKALQFQSKADKAADELATDIEAYMKANAPWTDRTGDARAGLYATTERSGSLKQGRFTTISFGHGVDYGFFLETMQGGRFSIVGPSLDYWAPLAPDRIWNR